MVFPPLSPDVAFVCVEAHRRGFESEIKEKEQKKINQYEEECKEVGLEFIPFVLGSHGGFGKCAKMLWEMLVKKADEIASRDWRHAWTSMSFSSTWLQKFSLSINSITATASLQRAPLFTRLSVLGESGEGDENGDWAGVRLVGGLE